MCSANNKQTKTKSIFRKKTEIKQQTRIKLIESRQVAFIAKVAIAQVLTRNVN